MSDRGMVVLILGGYGTFGGRLALLLSDQPRLTMIIAGRSLDKAAAFCRALPAGARAIPLAFDRAGDLDAQLQAARPDLLVDASGPFQAYGDHPYAVVEACIARGVHYLDLADGSDFVRGISGFDAAARRRDVVVLSGVSSFPVLTAAAVRALSGDMERVERIRGGIAPSPYAGVGLNVIRAIAGYAGRPVTLVRDGRPATGHAFTETLRYTIRPPGRLPLKPILFSLVDVPDLQVLPDLWPQLRSIWMGAGPVPEVLHRALIALAGLVRLGLIGSLAPLAPLFHRVTNVVRWGEHRGGMFVEVGGRIAGRGVVTRAWHLLAEGDDGPLIPSMAAEAIIRHMQDGRAPASGARPAVRELELSDYDALFARRTIWSGVRESPPPEAPLYRRLLAGAYDQLPPALQALHALDGEMIAFGEADVERGRGLLARLAAALVGFPAAGRQVPLRVAFRAKDGKEQWTRTFAGRSFSSLQMEGAGVSEGLLVERFGPMSVGLALVLDGDRLRLVVRHWSMLGLPLPRAMAPGGEAYETVEAGRFCFRVEIAHPLTGMIVRYRGWLEPQPPPHAPGGESDDRRAAQR